MNWKRQKERMKTPVATEYCSSLPFPSVAVIFQLIVIIFGVVMIIKTMLDPQYADNLEITSLGERALKRHADAWEVIVRRPGGVGLVLSYKDRPSQIAWLLGNRAEQYLVIGDVFDEEGNNLSVALAWRLNNEVSPSSTEAAPRSLASPTPTHLAPQSSQRFTTEQLLSVTERLDDATQIAHGFYQFDPAGGRKHVIVGFYDPACANCTEAHNTFAGMGADFEQADVDIRWLPVAILGTDNLRAATDLAKLLGREVTPELRDAVDMNTAALLHSQERPSVPYFIWKGKEFGSMLGAPRPDDVKKILSLFEERAEDKS